MNSKHMIRGMFILRHFRNNPETDVMVRPFSDCLYGPPLTENPERMTGLELQGRIAGLKEQEILQIDFREGRNEE